MTQLSFWIFFLHTLELFCFVVAIFFYRWLACLLTAAWRGAQIESQTITTSSRAKTTTTTHKRTWLFLLLLRLSCERVSFFHEENNPNKRFFFVGVNRPTFGDATFESSVLICCIFHRLCLRLCAVVVFFFVVVEKASEHRARIKEDKRRKKDNNKAKQQQIRLDAEYSDLSTLMGISSWMVSLCSKVKIFSQYFKNDFSFQNAYQEKIASTHWYCVCVRAW